MNFAIGSKNWNKEYMKRLLGLTFWLSLSAFAQAQDWPSFRGPNAAGVNDAKPLPAKTAMCMWSKPERITNCWRSIR